MRLLEGTNKPMIYIGNLKDASNETLLKKFGIGIVFNVCNDIATPIFPDCVYLKWGLDDPKLGLAFKNDLNAAAAVLDLAVYTHARRDDNILIHCAAGNNRSALVAAHWLNVYRNVKFKKAIKRAQVKDKKNWMIDKGFIW